MLGIFHDDIERSVFPETDCVMLQAAALLDGCFVCVEVALIESMGQYHFDSVKGELQSI